MTLSYGFAKAKIVDGPTLTSKPLDSDTQYQTDACSSLSPSL